MRSSSAIRLSMTAAVVVVLGAAALFVLPNNAGHPASDRIAPQPWIVLVVIAIAGIIWHLLLAVWRIHPHFAQWPLVLIPMHGSVAVVVATLWLVHRWSTARSWSDLHLLAIAVGAVISHSLVGCVILTHSAIDRGGVIVLGATALFILTTCVLRRTRNAIASTC